MIHHAERNHPELQCPKCGCAWFRIAGFAPAAVHYDAANRAFLDNVLVDESSRLLTFAVACMDCEYDCTSLVGDTFGPVFNAPVKSSDCMPEARPSERSRST